MFHGDHARTAGRRPAVLAVLVAAAALLGAAGCQYDATPPSSRSATPAATEPSATTESSATSGSPALAGPRHAAHPGAPGEADRAHRRSLGEADGSAAVTVFDDEQPTVANLDPALLAALRQAATDAADEGVEIVVTSGWRSAELQERLFQEAVSQYGSEAEAARWVATAETSAHVSGDAVDVGHSDATVWLSEHGADYGLCQVYANESWHYELRPDAAGHGCPTMYADPTEDPRMHR